MQIYKKIYHIYNQLSEDVNEAEIVTNAPTTDDYDNAQTNLVQGGIDIFNEYGDIDPALIEESNFFPTESIILTDKELAALINAFISNPLNLEKLGINLDQIGGLNTEVLEVNIATVDNVTIDLSFIVKLDMQDIKNQLGFFGFFLPDTLYVQAQNTLELIEGEYALISASIKVNNLDEETNTRMLEILVKALSNDNPDLTVQELNEATGRLILEGIKQASTTFNTSITFNNGSITFTPIASI